MPSSSSEILHTTQRELQEYRDILNVLPDIIYKIDDQGNFLYVSDSIKGLGYEPSELIGKHFHTIIHPADRNIITRTVVLPKFEGKKTGDEKSPKLFDERRTGDRGTRGLLVRLLSKAIAENASTAQVMHGEVAATGSFLEPQIQVEQKPMYAEVTNFGKYDRKVVEKEKRLMGTVGIIHDVTDKEQLESEKESLRQQLHQAQKMEAIGQLAGGIAHDFNNLLQAISGCADMIARKPDLERDRIEKYAKDILDVTQIASDLTSKLLAFARKGNLRRETFGMHRVITDLIQLLSHTLTAGIKIQTDLQARNTSIHGDLAQIQNAIINLAINARDAMDKGGVLTIRTSNPATNTLEFPDGYKRGRKKNYLKMDIVDTGKGMDKATQTRIFEPFFTTKKAGKGTGLGLASVYGIVDTHEGWITVESQVGVGTVFSLYLPVVNVSEVEKSSDLQMTPTSKQHKRTIMMVDDESMIREICTEMLEDLGYTVIAPLSPLEALDIYRARHNEIDLSIIDMVMPEMDGIALFRAMKKINPNTRAVLSTGYSVSEDSGKLKDEGVIHLISKPFVSRTLSDVLQKAFAKIGG